MSPAERRQVVEQVREQFHSSEHRAGRAIRQPRSTQRDRVRSGDADAPLTKPIVALATRYGRYGDRRITALLHQQGWRVNHPCLPQDKCKRVERIWRREGLKGPARQPKRGRLWLKDGSCVRLRPEYPLQVWRYDFMRECAHDGKPFRILSEIPIYR